MSALFVNFLIDPYLKEVLKEIRCRNPELVSYLACHERPTEELTSLPFLDSSLLYNANSFEKAFNNIPPKNLKQNEIKNLFEGLMYVQKSIDRVAPMPNSIHYNEIYFWELCEYFKSFFTLNKNIKNIVFDATPHLPHDLILFFIAKELSIKTIILKRTGIAGLCYLNEDFRHEKNFWKFNYGLENKLKEIFNEKKNFIYELKNLEFAKDQINGQWPEDVNKKSVYRNISSFIKRYKKLNFIIFLFRIIKDVFSLPYIQKEGASKNFFLNSAFYHNQKIKYIDYFFLKIRYSLKLSKLINDDKKNLINTNILKNKTYIFFPLHFQPEASTLPEGGFYENQYLSLKIISENLPDNYLLVVKEHPKQLFYDIRNFHFRSESFYVKIKKLKNTLLFSAISNYSEILKSSKIVATISGSVAWQGLLSGKPTIVFSDMWLNDCKSVLMYQSNEHEFKKKILNISSHSTDKVYENIKSFLQENSNYFFDSIIFHKHSRFTDDIKNCIINLTFAVISRLK